MEFLQMFLNLFHILIHIPAILLSFQIEFKGYESTNTLAVKTSTS